MAFMLTRLNRFSKNPLPKAPGCFPRLVVNMFGWIVSWWHVKKNRHDPLFHQLNIFSTIFYGSSLVVLDFGDLFMSKFALSTDGLFLSFWGLHYIPQGCTHSFGHMVHTIFFFNGNFMPVYMFCTSSYALLSPSLRMVVYLSLWSATDLSLKAHSSLYLYCSSCSL